MRRQRDDAIALRLRESQKLTLRIDGAPGVVRAIRGFDGSEDGALAVANGCVDLLACKYAKLRCRKCVHDSAGETVSTSYDGTSGDADALSNPSTQEATQSGS